MSSVYRMYCKRGELLYVGKSVDLFHRLTDHAKTQAWYGLIFTIRVDHFETDDLAIKAEKNAIKTEQPIYNVVHANYRRGPWAILNKKNSEADGWYFNYSQAIEMFNFYSEINMLEQYLLIERGERGGSAATTCDSLIMGNQKIQESVA